MSDISRAEDLAGKLARYPGPAYRKAYLANLLASGNRFLEAGNARGAGYCHAKVAEGLGAFASESGEPETGHGEPEAAAGEADLGSGQDAVPASDAPPQERKPRAPRVKPMEKTMSASELFRRQWRLQRLQDAESILRKHGGRLSALENQSYRDRLEKLRQSGQSASTPTQSDKADAGLLDLRRRLYQRVLKSQRIALSRQRMPVTLARLALPPAEARSSFAPAPAKVRVDTEWQPVTGPYNDRYNMEDLLSLIADADAAWVQEFLDLYRGLADVQGLVSVPLPAKK